MKNFKFSLIWPIILSLSMFCDQLCHGMKFWDQHQQKHIEISVDDFFTKKPAGGSQTYFESVAHFAELSSPSTSTQGFSERNIQAFWVPGRRAFSSTKGGEVDAPLYGLGRFLFGVLEMRSCLSDLGQKTDKKMVPWIIINNEQERDKFKTRLWREIANKLQKRDGFDVATSGDVLSKILNWDIKLPKLVRPMPGCFYGSQARFLTGASFVLTFGLSLIGCVAHHFRKNAEDVTEQEKSDRKKAIICSAVLAAISGGLFAASYWELGSRYDYKRFFNIPPA